MVLTGQKYCVLKLVRQLGKFSPMYYLFKLAKNITKSEQEPQSFRGKNIRDFLLNEGYAMKLKLERIWKNVRHFLNQRPQISIKNFETLVIQKCAGQCHLYNLMFRAKIKMNALCLGNGFKWKVYRLELIQVVMSRCLLTILILRLVGMDYFDRD